MDIEQKNYSITVWMLISRKVKIFVFYNELCFCEIKTVEDHFHYIAEQVSEQKYSLQPDIVTNVAKISFIYLTYFINENVLSYTDRSLRYTETTSA